MDEITILSIAMVVATIITLIINVFSLMIDILYSILISHSINDSNAITYLIPLYVSFYSLTSLLVEFPV